MMDDEDEVMFEGKDGEIEPGNEGDTQSQSNSLLEMYKSDPSCSISG